MTTHDTNTRERERGRNEPEPRRTGNRLLDPEGRYRTPPGSEPMTALTARGLRTVLAAVFVPLFTLATVGLSFAAWLSPPPPAKPSREDFIFLAAVCFFGVVAFGVDLVVNLSRRRYDRRHRRRG